MAGRVTLGEQLRAARAAAGLTQEAVAERAGVHRVTVARLESGERAGDLATWERVAEAVGRRLELVEG